MLSEFVVPVRCTKPQMRQASENSFKATDHSCGVPHNAGTLMGFLGCVRIKRGFQVFTYSLKQLGPTLAIGFGRD